VGQSRRKTLQGISIKMPITKKFGRQPTELELHAGRRKKEGKGKKEVQVKITLYSMAIPGEAVATGAENVNRNNWKILNYLWLRKVLTPRNSQADLYQGAANEAANEQIPRQTRERREKRAEERAEL